MMMDHLKRLAKRVTDDPFFLASVLDAYAKSEQMDDSQLASRLGCSVASLTHLRLCRNPKPEPPHFWQDVQAISSRFHANADALAEVVRHGQNLLSPAATDTAAAERSAGFFMAARDDDESSEPDNEE